MDGQDIVTVSAAVVALTEIVKGFGAPSRHAPLVALLLSAVGVVIWAFSALDHFERSQLFGLFAGWIVVASAAKGAYEGAKNIGLIKGDENHEA